MDNHNIFVYF